MNKYDDKILEKYITEDQMENNKSELKPENPLQALVSKPLSEHIRWPNLLSLSHPGSACSSRTRDQRLREHAGSVLRLV